MVAVRPSSDVTLGGWTNESGGTSLFSSLNEASRSDVSLVRSVDNPANATFEVALSNPNALNDGTLNIVIGKGINNAIVINQTVALIQGTTEIASWPYPNVPYGPTLKTEALTGPQLAAITNFADLRVRVTASIGAASPLVLDLDFTTGTLDSRVAFSRSTTATYVDSSGLVAYAAANAPRFDYDPVTLQILGLLLEPSRTNYALSSQQIDDTGVWTQYGGGSGSAPVITANAAVAPDGTTTADLLVVNRTDILGDSLVYQHWGPGGIATGTYTLSVWLKAKTGSEGKVVTIALQKENNVIGEKRHTLTSSWVRVDCQGSLDIANHAYLHVGYVDPFGAPDTGGPTGLAELYVWGTMLEPGSFPTSYIPTTSAAVTRAADDAVIGGTNFTSWYVAGPGTFVFENIQYSTNATALSVFGHGGDSIVFNHDGESQLVDDSVVQADFTPGAPSLGVPHKRAMAYATNDVAYVIDGGTVLTDTSASVPTAFDVGVSLGYHPLFGIQAKTHIRSLKYFTLRKTNAELIELTAPAVTDNLVTMRDGSQVTDRAGNPVVLRTV